MSVQVDLRAQAEVVAKVAAGVADEQLDGPTPCPEYSVRELLAHLVHLSVAFRDAGRKDLGPTTNTDPNAAIPELPADWREALPVRLAELAAAWRQPGAWEGMTQAGGFTFPAAEAGLVACNEIVIHGWDLARATGQDYAPDPGALDASLRLLEAGKDEAERGPFGPVVAVRAGAPALEQAVGLSGRRPDWAPQPVA
ncbi:TIGR03086 family protein [Streptomyces sp. A7024]|uniref:TIGR03086 family protein n=1 Tax=Streptomyces coryli TaxID=1128680 RepID=A0A6G4UBA8_9ACTN|nr:TIGR03086 family metal-binding protein [Streptomyces coryli]NGN69292.1 TIGR03086 family protein [Streptomyces coryli]